MEYTKATKIDSDLFFFIWQVYTVTHVRIFEKNILIEQGKLEEGWNCNGFDDWAYKYNKTDIFRNFIERALYFGLLDEAIISIRELGKNKNGYPEIMEIERFEVNIKFLEEFRRGFPHRHDRNDNIYSKFELFFNGFYSLQKNSYALYFSYKVNHKNINSFIEDYLIDWFQDKLIKPRNYIKPNIQVETFSDTILSFSSIYGNSFDYFLGTNPDLDESTLIIYFQALGWISIKEFDDGISPILHPKGNERKRFYLQLEQKYFEHIQRKLGYNKIYEDGSIANISPFKINNIGEVYLNDDLITSYKLKSQAYRFVKLFIDNYGKPLSIETIRKETLGKDSTGKDKKINKTNNEWFHGYFNKKNIKELKDYIHNIGIETYTLKNLKIRDRK